MNTSEVAKFVNHLRYKYPYVSKCEIMPKGRYCVGGAVCREAESWFKSTVINFADKLRHTRFPLPLKLRTWLYHNVVNNTTESYTFPEDYFVGEQLQRLNPKLWFDQAKDAGLVITSLNDRGAFEEAWHVVELALNDNTDLLEIYLKQYEQNH